jgi:RimJ/RimL family protein N-acetyltransferase
MKAVSSDLPIGPEVDPFLAERPQRTTLPGRIVTLMPLDADAHADALFQQVEGPHNDHLWAYLWDGPYTDAKSFRADLRLKSQSEDPLFYAIVDNGSQRAVGYASFLRIEPKYRVIEVGNILFTPDLQKTAGATEAMYLMARYVFEDLGYRRYEWKCNALNAPSRSAALRLGFSFEGIFRQHMIIKGRNRDTAWFAMLDSEWPPRKTAFEGWLSPDNFDHQERQKHSLSEFKGKPQS